MKNVESSIKLNSQQILNLFRGWFFPPVTVVQGPIITWVISLWHSANMVVKTRVLPISVF